MDIPLEDIRKEIKNIINNSNLLNVTPKSLRSNLEEKFKTDLTERKSIIDEIIIQELSYKQDTSNKSVNNAYEALKPNGESDNSSSSSDDDEIDTKEPSKKKKKVMSDEELARQLHAEENSSRRHSKTPAKKKSKDKVGLSKKSAFAKDCSLSKELSVVIGKDKCPRSEVVKAMWKYFKDNNLMDPQNKQYVICDDKLINIFGKKKFKAFGMMKDLKKHIFDEFVA